jgi:hypothetical protein
MTPVSDSWLTDFADSVSITSKSPSLPSGGTSAGFAAVGLRMAGGSGGSGVDGEYDGGAKRAHLFLFDTAMATARICLGFVGAENKRFCLKHAPLEDRQSGIWTCGVQKHLVKFEPMENMFYPCANEAIGFCTPSFPSFHGSSWEIAPS